MPLSSAPANFKQSKPLYKPYKSTRQGKKGMVYVNKNGSKRLIHFGDSSMSDMTKHKDPKRQKSYLARSGEIRTLRTIFFLSVSRKCGRQLCQLFLHSFLYLY